MTVLYFRINQAEPMFEKGRQISAGKIAVLIDRGCQDRASVLTIPGGVIRAAAKEGYAIGSSAYDHTFGPAASDLAGSSCRSTNSQITCSIVRWASWILACTCISKIPS